MWYNNLKKVGVYMNDLLERYLGAVCSYFIGPKRQRVYNELKNQILESVHQYDDLEDLLVNYGNPRSLALSFGYRPIFLHIYNPQIVSLIEKTLFIISGIYLFFSTLYYLSQLNCLPFQTSTQVIPPVLTLLLSHPFEVMCTIATISIILLLIIDQKYMISQSVDPKWSIEKLYELPHQSHYPNHNIETIFMIVFSIYFLIYTIFFNRDIIMQIQHESYKMIHLMTYFFQPFIMIIFVDYIIDMTKRIYTRKYLKYSSAINIFIILSLSLFIYKSHFLNDYLLPVDININYILVNVFIIGALAMIFFIAVYKLLRNLNSYRSLFKK